MAFKVGDKVCIYRKVTKAKGWSDRWVEEMDDYVGQEGVVLYTQGAFGINNVRVGFPSRTWNVPACALKHVKG